MIRGRLVLFAVLVLAASAPATAAGQVMEWSSPLQLDPGSPSQFSNGSGIACAGEQLCVATGGEGKLLVSTDPTAGREGWEEAEVDPSPAALTAVSCPSEDFCAVADAEGRLLTSTEPSADAAAWSSATIDAGHEIVSISCPSADFCAAADDAGQVLVSDEPGGGAAAWSAGTPIAATPIQISCASTSLCALAYDGLNIYNEPPGLMVSTDPLAGAGSWTDAGLGLGEEWTEEAFGVSCPSDDFCGFAYSGGILVSSDPAGGSSTWHLTHSISEEADPGLIHPRYSTGLGITCPSAEFCVAQLYFPATQSFHLDEPRLLTSSQPASQGSWTVQTMNREWNFGRDGMVCVSLSFCATIDRSGWVSTSTEPAGGAEAWNVALTGPTEPDLTSVACPSRTFCAATGTLGRLYTSTEPSDPDSWTVTHLAEYVNSVNCSSPTWCTVAAEGPTGPTVLYATEPRGGAGAWSAVARISGRALTCPEPGFCAQLANYDEVLASTDPLAGSASWTATDMKLPDWRLGPSSLGHISCPAANLCVTGGTLGWVFASSEPTGPLAGWVWSFAGDPSNYYNGAGPSVSGLTCPTTSFCAVTTGGETVATTTDPLGGSGAWTVSQVSGSYFIGQISCAQDASLCVAVDGAGHAVTSRTPLVGSNSWGTLETIDDVERLHDVSCAEDGSLCAVVDAAGRIVVGLPTHPGEGSGLPSGVSPGPPPPGAPAPAPHPCRKAKPHKKAKRGPAIAPRHKVSNGGRRSKSRCARPR